MKILQQVRTKRKYPIYPLVQPTNREERRKMNKEFKQHLLPFLEIEADFLSEIFRDSHSTYNEIYYFHNMRFLCQMKLFTEKKNPYFCADTRYFSDMYKPLEQPINHIY